MSLPRRLPPTAPDPDWLALFEQPQRVPLAVRRQAEFFVFFAHTIFALLEQYRDRLATVYGVDNGRPAWDPVRLLAVLVLQFVLRVPDRQAAEAVQYDQRWRLALHLTAQDATFDPSLLVSFRDRLVTGQAEDLVGLLGTLCGNQARPARQSPGAGSPVRTGRRGHVGHLDGGG